MNDYEWANSIDPHKMTAYLENEVISSNYQVERKLRLIACACCRMNWDKLIDDRSRKAVEVAEQFADGLSSTSKRSTASIDAMEVLDEYQHNVPVVPRNQLKWATWAASTCAQRTPSRLARKTIDRAINAGATHINIANAIRCIIGDPFKPSVIMMTKAEKFASGHGHIAYEWVTPIVKSLAQAAYGELINNQLDPERLTILADALEEAGCPSAIVEPCPRCSEYIDNENNPWRGTHGHHPERDPASGRHEGGYTNCKVCNSGSCHNNPGFISTPNKILSHLRSMGSHWRGCYVVDLILRCS